MGDGLFGRTTTGNDTCYKMFLRTPALSSPLQADRRVQVFIIWICMKLWQMEVSAVSDKVRFTKLYYSDAVAAASSSAAVSGSYSLSPLDFGVVLSCHLLSFLNWLKQQLLFNNRLWLQKEVFNLSGLHFRGDKSKCTEGIQIPTNSLRLVRRGDTSNNEVATVNRDLIAMVVRIAKKNNLYHWNLL